MPSGRCLCGDVTYEIGAPLRWMTHCHCSRCRKAHGTAFATFAGAPASALRWTHGEAGVRHFASSPGLARAYCGRCGSKLPVRWRDEVHAPAGTLGGDAGIRPGKHVFVASKAPWHEIRDSLPQHAGSSSGDPQLGALRATEPASGAVRGACLCGGVAFELDGPLAGGGITSCHCSRCRRARGAAHGSNLLAALANFRWLRGESRLRSFKVPEALRFTQCFCADCGSPMPGVNAAAGRVVVPCGSLEDDPGEREERHIFVSSRAPWFEIAGSLPQFAEGAPPPFPRVSEPVRSERP